MLIAFSVGNFRSFKDTQTFSMVAGSAPVQCFQTGLSDPKELVPIAAFFGANASGKSNLVAAMSFFRDLILNSAARMTRGDKIKVTPFAFSQDNPKEPSFFEIVFIADQKLYRYGFTADNIRVYQEWLFVQEDFPLPFGEDPESEQLIFDRYYRDETEKYEFDFPEIEGDLKNHLLNSVRENELVLSRGAQININPFYKIHDWVNNSLFIIETSRDPESLIYGSYITSTFSFMRDKDSQEKILSFIKNIDSGVVGFDIKDSSKPVSSAHANDGFLTLLAGGVKEIRFVRNIEGQSYTLPLESESEGTRLIFKLFGSFLRVLESGAVLVVDELHNSLHPLLVKAIVNLFQDPQTNPHHAQLIFTSHDSSILDDLEKDQIWIVEKSSDGGSVLISVLSYRIDEDTDKRTAYLSGRFGGIPAIERLLGA